jgi:hypothetical protein
MSQLLKLVSVGHVTKRSLVFHCFHAQPVSNHSQTTGKSASAAVQRAIERITDHGLGHTVEVQEFKPAPRVAFNLPTSNDVFANNASAATVFDNGSHASRSNDPTYLDPSFWLTSFGAQHNDDASADSSEPQGESHAFISTKVSAFPQSPLAARQSLSTRSSLSVSSASASNSSIRDAIESYRKATMFIMPHDISSDSSDGDSRSRNTRQNLVISSDSESEQSEPVDSTIDYLNRRVRIERDQLLQTAGHRARLTHSSHHDSSQQVQSNKLSSKSLSHRRVAFAASPSSKAMNSHALPHELRRVHIVAETERRWKNLPEVCPEISFWFRVVDLMSGAASNACSGSCQISRGLSSESKARSRGAPVSIRFPTSRFVIIYICFTDIEAKFTCQAKNKEATLEHTSKPPF